MTVSPVGVHYAGEMKEVNTENLQPLKSGTEEIARFAGNGFHYLTISRIVFDQAKGESVCDR
jgi:hypothetical protein